MFSPKNGQVCVICGRSFLRRRRLTITNRLFENNPTAARYIINNIVPNQVYAGSETQFSLEELEAGAEYLVRVMAVRGGLGSAWSAAARLVVPAARARKRPGVGTTGTAAGPAAGAGAGGAASGAGARRTALLMAAAFLLLAVGVAVLLQRLVEPRP